MSGPVSRILKLSLSRIPAYYDKLDTAARMEACDAAASASVWLARVSAYISRRLSGGKHEDAVKAQNACAAKVRQALGYTYKDDKLTFPAPGAQQ